MTETIPLVLAFLAGVFVGAAIVLFLDTGTQPVEPLNLWPRAYPGCDRCMSLRFRGTPESLTIHQSRVHARVLSQGPAAW